MHPAFHLDQGAPVLEQVFGQDHPGFPGTRGVRPGIAEGAALGQAALAVEEVHAADIQVVLAQIDSAYPVTGCETDRWVPRCRAQHMMGHPVQILAVLERIVKVAGLLALEVGDGKVRAEHLAGRSRAAAPAALRIARDKHGRSAQVRGGIDHQQALVAACVIALIKARSAHRMPAQAVAEDQRLFLVHVGGRGMAAERIFDQRTGVLRPCARGKGEEHDKEHRVHFFSSLAFLPNSSDCGSRSSRSTRARADLAVSASSCVRRMTLP